MRTPKRSKKPPDSEAPGPVEADVLYPLADFKARTGLGEFAMRTARRRGLKVTYAGNRGFVLGRDFLDYLTTHSVTHN